jgi:hypothetical protein
MEANTMIEMTTAASLYTNNSLGRTQGTGSFYYEESGQLATAETFTFSGDQVSLSYRSESVTTYNSSMTMEGVLTDAYDLLRGLVLNIVEKQGIDSTFTAGETEVDLSTLSQEEAQELVADDGYFGVEKTSDRIFNFAVGIAGGDPSRIDAIREGVQQGFDEALDAFGGWLPDISYDTYDAVMNKLDEWVAQA